MSEVAYRNATLDDAALVADLFERSFVETFGHLYGREDLGSFLAGITPEAFAAEIASPEFALRIAERGDGPIAFAKLGPPSFPVETPPATLELWQIYVLKDWQGERRRAGALRLGRSRSSRSRRRTSAAQRLCRQSPRQAFL